MMGIGIDAFRGYEFFLAILLLTANDPAIERTRPIFLQWFREEIEASGASQAIDRIVQIMKEEHGQLMAQQNLARRPR